MNRFVSLALVSSLVALGCGGGGDGKKELAPVKGVISVDGKPTAGIQVQLIAPGAAQVTTVSTGMSGDDGSFQISTYEQNDGAPIGEYTAIFTWQPMAVMNQGAEVPDKLNNRYSDATASTFKVKVESGKPVDMGTIELKTK